MSYGVTSVGSSPTGGVLMPIIPDLGIISAVAYLYTLYVSGTEFKRNILSSSAEIVTRAVIDLAAYPIILGNTAVVMAAMALKVKVFMHGTLFPVIGTLVQVSCILQVALYVLELVKKGFDICMQKTFMDKCSMVFSQYAEADQIEDLGQKSVFLLERLQDAKTREAIYHLTTNKQEQALIIGYYEEAIKLLQSEDSATLEKRIQQVSINICLIGINFLKAEDSLIHRVTPNIYGLNRQFSSNVTAILTQAINEDTESEILTALEQTKGLLFTGVEIESRKVMTIHIIAFIGIFIALAGAAMVLGGLPMTFAIPLYFIGWGLYMASGVAYCGYKNQIGWNFNADDCVPDCIKKMHRKISRIPEFVRSIEYRSPFGYAPVF